MWILKQEQCETEKSSVKLQEYKEKHKKPQNENANAITDEEILLVEDDDNVDEDSGNLDETEMIFQQFLKNQNEQFQTSQLEAENAPEKLSCRICNFKTNTKISLHQHVQSVHEINRHRRVQFCHFWNNFGTCNFEEKRGVPCKFEHKPAPTCNFDGECTRKRCMYSHKKQNMSFLASQQRGVRQNRNHPATPVWTSSHPFVNQEARRTSRPQF